MTKIFYHNGYPGVMVDKFIEELELAISGKEYCGYKGGIYTYTEDNVLHVDNNGSWTQTEITGLIIDEYSVVMTTGINRDYFN